MPDSKAPPYPFRLALVVALLLALLHLPYGYYQLLKFGACAIGAWSAWATWADGRKGIAGAWAVFALLYNPVIPVRFDRDTWSVINVASAAFVLWAAWLSWRANRRVS